MWCTLGLDIHSDCGAEHHLAKENLMGLGVEIMALPSCVVPANITGKHGQEEEKFASVSSQEMIKTQEFSCLIPYATKKKKYIKK